MSKRQIVFIMTDSQRWDMVSCYRDTGLSTPCIDSIASDGMRFERAYTTQPVCQPARAGIFTGQYPHSVGSWTNSMGISDNVRTLGRRLGDAGLHAAYIGKWHLDGGDYFGLGKCPDGWDERYWYDMKRYLDELSPEERVFSRSTKSMLKTNIEAGFTYGHRCTDRAIDFIGENRGSDFFLTVSYDEPHGPFLCPEPYSSMYENYAFPKSENVYDSLASKPSHQRAWAGQSLSEDKKSLEIKNRFFFGCNSYIDSEIGRLYAEIKKSCPDAYVIYTSDHGDMLSSHSLSGKGPCAYDEITRIPLIIRGPGIESGSLYRYPVSHINLAPTLMELAGVEIPRIFEGKSITPCLSDTDIRVNDCVFIEFGRYEVDHDGFGGFQPLRAVYDGKYKLVINLLCEDELYDTEADPGEMVNLICDESLSSVRDRLHDALLRNMNQTRDPFRGYWWERRPWRKDARDASWDYTGMTRQREENYEARQLDYSTGLEMTEASRVK